jgi:hypothetical protein
MYFLLLTGLSTFSFRATADRLRPPELSANDGIGATHSGANRQSTCGAIFCACATFHAEIQGYDSSFAVFDLKYRMRANIRAHSATAAARRVDFQGGHIFQV